MRVNTAFARVLLFLFAAAFVAAMSLMVNVAFLNRGFAHFGVLTLASIFTGITAGALVLQQSLSQYDNEQMKRSRTIAEMNHHIRNALTVLLFYGMRGDDQEARVAVSLAVQRVEWALEVVLPEGWHPEPETQMTQKALAARVRKRIGSPTAGARYS